MISTLRQLWTSFQPGSRLVDGGDCLNLANQMTSTKAGITALAAGGAAGAPIASAAINEVSVCATDNDSVILPQAIPGVEITVINDGASTLAVFPLQSNPATGSADQIVPHGTAVAGASATQATCLTASYYCFKPGVWKQSLSA